MEKRNPAETLTPPFDLTKNFFLKFKGVRLTNSDGKEITLKIRQEKSDVLISKKNLPESDQAAWIIEFEGFDPKGPYSELDRTPQNYIELESVQNEINVNYAKLTNPELLGKNIYPQILRLIGEFFPENYILTSVIDHPETKKQILEAVDKFKALKISERDRNALIAQSNLISKTIKAGFNYYTFRISEDSERTVYETAEKIKNQPEVIIKILSPAE